MERDVVIKEVEPMFSPRKLAQYFCVDESAITKARRAGRIPPPDLRFGNRPRWLWRTVQAITENGQI